MNAPLSSRLQMSLDDRLTQTRGCVYMTGLQALVRLPIQQRLRDRAVGLNTGGFISGYRGSPIGRYDMELTQAASVLRAHDIHFQPGVNEDLAATASWGSQYVGVYPGARVDGVFSMWYGKTPGLDRSMDVLKHANLAGTSKFGGMLLLVGDDPGAKSSTLACYSEMNFPALGVPLLAPATVQEVLDFGLYGIALSRYAGTLAGMKLVTDVVEGGGSIEVGLDRPRIEVPQGERPAMSAFIPFLEQERSLFEHRLGLVESFVACNELNRLVEPAGKAEIGIVAAGKAWVDLEKALQRLGMREGMLSGRGVRLLKVGVPWPLEVGMVRRFADGLSHVIVVEEKRAFLEDQLRAILYGMETPPFVTGKRHGTGRFAGQPAFPAVGELSPALVARTIAQIFGLPLPDAPRALIHAAPPRMPTFCAGCPHGRSTKVISGSRAMAGIGCHSIAMLQDPTSTNAVSHMGGEGAMWIGQHPFTDEPHVFANMGDGTYFHSGYLAIRAAVAAGVPITYKLLFNGFVSMTGGQPVDGELSVSRAVSQLRAEGVERIAIVADEPAAHTEEGRLPGVTVHPRFELERVQEELRGHPGVSVLIYDQPCATERRRLRKRGKWPDPDRRVHIDPEICEGCGDCSAVSGCMAIEPLETPLGRKRRINQSSCNKDFSCLEGFCPSLVSLEGATPRKRRLVSADPLAGFELPEPNIPSPEGGFSVLLAGVGGTGVVTIGQILAVAAHADGLVASNLDITGLAQKYGAVLSHVKIANQAQHLGPSRIDVGEARTLIGTDLIVTASAEVLNALSSEGVVAVVDHSVMPTSEFSRNPDWSVDPSALTQRIAAKAGIKTLFAGLTPLAEEHLGDAIFANQMSLGAAWQSGGLPVSRAALTRAIELNGVAIEANKRAFALGRLLVVAPERLGLLRSARAQSLSEIVADRSARLVRYSGKKLAARYETVVGRVATADAGDGQPLARAVATYYYKLLAHKDEWEIARIYASADFRRRIDETFEGNLRISFHVGGGPFARPGSGSRPPKVRLGEWAMPLFRIASALRGLRGTFLDPFRSSAEAVLARSLLAEYEADVETVLAIWGTVSSNTALELLSWPEEVRGYGSVRERCALAARAKRTAILKNIQSK
ncbi:indolepyruvate ferredoxin oxidoreductase family protein [Mesorhizobium sp. 1B3]|uniref:indolepyruvate ferredoxin oxidoreductase family protein n=1 Tax=Mesorhizobium sp. 1B3 TaxID=3243599 RepID=UPI003D97A7D2